MSSTPNTDPSFVSRVLTNDTARKGFAGAVAGILIATILELWPTKG
jgi:hypothetical protein